MVLSMFEPGSCFILVRKWLGSLADCERALKLDPRLVTAICTQADVKRLLGDYKGAVSDATVALRHGRDLGFGWLWKLGGIAPIARRPSLYVTERSSELPPFCRWAELFEAGEARQGGPGRWIQ